MKLEKLKPGMTVYRTWREQVRKGVGRTNIDAIEIKDVNFLQRTVIARRTGGFYNICREYDWKKWRLKKPETVRLATGATRLKTRKELRADKQKRAKP